MMAVGPAAMRRARARMASAGTSVMGAAHSGVFAWPSLSPVRYLAKVSKPTVYLSRYAWSWSFSSYRT